MVMEVVHEDVGEGNMQCTNHPYKNSTPGGICAFCLQEKLGKLVSSTYPTAVFPSSPSYTRSAAAAGGGGSDSSTLQSAGNEYSYNNGRKPRLPFVLTHKKKKKKDTAPTFQDSTSIVFKRSKSTTTPRRGIHFLNENSSEDYSPNRRGFWSFLYLSKQSTPKKKLKNLNFTSTGGSGLIREKQNEDENGSPFERKVSRSRSVGCGSRSFSGDFFERISTGFGDCTLRRVESQREGKCKVQPMHRNGQERVKCGGIFSGFMVNSSSSSSSSSSYLIGDGNLNGKSSVISHGRSKSWGWSFASPMRAAFGGKNSSGKRDATSNKNSTPNLAAIPSLLAVSS